MGLSHENLCLQKKVSPFFPPPPPPVPGSFFVYYFSFMQIYIFPPFDKICCCRCCCCCCCCCPFWPSSVVVIVVPLFLAWIRINCYAFNSCECSFFIFQWPQLDINMSTMIAEARLSCQASKQSLSALKSKTIVHYQPTGITFYQGQNRLGVASTN